MGRATVDRLIEIKKDRGEEQKPACHEETFPVKLLIRDSTGQANGLPVLVSRQTVPLSFNKSRL